MLLLLLLVVPTTNAAFLNDLVSRAFQPKPELKELSKTIPGQVLDIHLDLDEPNKMSLQDLKLSLRAADASDEHISMPGYNGPHPGTSSGPGRIDIQKPGHFIDLSGTVTAKFGEIASWEVIWRHDAPAGALMLGLDLQQDAVRNKSVLKKGRIYLSFPLWTAATLSEYQERKIAVNAAAAQNLKVRDEQLQKMQNTDNLLQKALHYRNAFAAVEEYSMQPVARMAKVPDNDSVIKISDDLILTKVGTAWTKQTSGGSAFMMGASQKLLGTATITEPVGQDDDDDDVENPIVRRRRNGRPETPNRLSKYMSP